MFKSFAFMAVASLSLSLQAAPQPNQPGFLYPPPQSMMVRTEPMQTLDKNAVNMESLTIVKIVEADPSMSSLSKALRATNLEKTLNADGQFTLFAPNDLAFAKLSPNALADLMKPENKEKLTAILNYHVVPNKLTAKDLKAGQLRTANGKSLEVKISNGQVAINNAKVIKTDKIGSNGVIHVIDTVLMP